jgi:hypothetical protein
MKACVFLTAESRMMQAEIVKYKWSAQASLPGALRLRMSREVDIPDDAPSTREGRGRTETMAWFRSIEAVKPEDNIE